MSALVFTGADRRAAEHILSTPFGQRLHEVATIGPIGKPWLSIDVPDDVALSSGEHVMLRILTSFSAAGCAFSARDLAGVDDGHWDAVITALFLARGRDLTAAAS